MSSQINNKKKFYIHTLGCKVNQYESQAMRELLIEAGYEESGPKDPADFYIVNTCTVTAEADRESKYLMGQFHRANPSADIVVTGCLAENNASDLVSMPWISHVIKNSDKNRIAQVIGTSEDLARGQWPKELSISDFKGRSKAYVKIQDGCDNRCSYCKVPLVRSRLKSKPTNDIVEEVRGLTQDRGLVPNMARNGFKEIVLTGICLGAWGKDLNIDHMARSAAPDAANLVDVLKALDSVDGDFRIRLSSIEPKYVTDELIEFMAANKRICAHLHIPFQSGDDDVLKLMNRPYTSSEYRAIVDRVRAGIPHIAVTTDILIGFPGETTERFRNTMAFVRAIAPSRTHIFTFSRREGTPAYDMQDTADQSDLKKRYNDMNTITLETSDAYRRSFLGKELNVLVETKRDKLTGLLKGYSDNYIHMLFEAPDDLMRKIVPVKVAGFDSEKTMGVYER